jgi:hypothetical protein
MARAEETAPQNFDSLYTDISGKQCKTLEQGEESGYVKQSCHGIAGYTLLVEDFDTRVSITVVTPDKREFPLNLWEKVTPNFSGLGNKAEWRIPKSNGRATPAALIVRVNEIKTESGQRKSYLAVAKITAAEICLTSVIQPGKTQNELARQAADKAQTSPCLK